MATLEAELSHTPVPVVFQWPVPNDQGPVPGVNPHTPRQLGFPRAN